MTGTVLDAKSLQETLLRLIPTEKVRVWEDGGEIRLTPVIEESAERSLRGLCADSGLTVDKFLEWKRADKARD